MSAESSSQSRTAMVWNKQAVLELARHNATSVRLGLGVLPWRVPAEMASRRHIQHWLEKAGVDYERVSLYCAYEQVDWDAIVEILSRAPEPPRAAQIAE